MMEGGSPYVVKVTQQGKQAAPLFIVPDLDFIVITT
jgi:hypothetical protein